jgi:hypothetical protein
VRKERWPHMVGIEVETTSKGGKIVTAAKKKKIDETS